MENNESTENAVTEQVTDKQQKTTYSFRVTEEQKYVLQNYQKQFDNQSVFLLHIFELLKGEGGRQSEVKNPYEMKLEFTPLEWALLEWVADRESTDDIQVKVDTIFWYLFDYMLIQGNKLSIDCIPDRVINRLKKEYSDV